MSFVFFLLCKSLTAVFAIVGFAQVFSVTVGTFHNILPFWIIFYNYTTYRNIAQLKKAPILEPFYCVN
jgi:hypothetical protein